jgi:hypothetical protein
MILKMPEFSENSRGSEKDNINVTTENMIAMLPQQAMELYKTELNTLIVSPKKSFKFGIPMKKVIRVIIRALTVRRPKARCVVGS